LGSDSSDSIYILAVNTKVGPLKFVTYEGH
jgi:hypothetical protein